MASKHLRNRFIVISGVIGTLTIASSFLGYWSVEKMSTALSGQTLVGTALKNHMTADMMHDAVRADVIAAMLAARSGEDVDAVEKTMEGHLAEFKTILRRIRSCRCPLILQRR